MIVWAACSRPQMSQWSLTFEVRKRLEVLRGIVGDHRDVAMEPDL